MDLHLFEPEELPRPRADMRFERAEVAPYPDGRRVHLTVSWTAFSDRPSLDAVILSPAGKTVAAFAVIEAIAREMEFTLHLRAAAPGPGYRLLLSLYYGPAVEDRQAAAARNEELPDQVVDTREVEFAVPEPRPAAPEGPEQAEEATRGSD